MFDAQFTTFSEDAVILRDLPPRPRHSVAFPLFKRAFDIVGSIVLIPILLVATITLVVINPIWNRGPLFFFQTRMGRDCQTFTALKFRTMAKTQGPGRTADEPLEHNRITPLGRILRQFRLDELPQLLNVLSGEMSLIGPRPDFVDHAQEFLATIPGYRERHLFRPGISGLAQTQIGYAQGHDETARKVRADLVYIQNAGVWIDVWLTWKTIKTVLLRKGV